MVVFTLVPRFLTTGGIDIHGLIYTLKGNDDETSFKRKVLSIRASWLDSRYAIDGEDIGGEMRELIRDCLFSPNAENGAFDEASFAKRYLYK